MSGYNVQTKYVSHKISKVCWRPPVGFNSELPTVFLTGGCDNDDGNTVALWLTAPTTPLEKKMADDNGISDDEPQFLCSSTQNGDVTDLVFLTDSAFISASSNGDVNLFKYNEEFQILNLHHKWSKLHHYSDLSGSPCTGVASLPGGEVVATVGKEGQINLLHQPLLRPSCPVTVITDKASETSPNSIKFLQRSTLAIINSAGQLKLWEASGNRSQPSKVFELTNDAVSFLSIDQHPSQSHIIIVGAEDGRLYVWDLRQEKKPVAIHEGHSCDVLGVKFHPDLPNNVFTCSGDGSLWHWGSNESSLSTLFNISRDMTDGPRGTAEVGSNLWLFNRDAPRSRVIINDLLAGNTFPVNSLDVIGNRLVSGLDGEQLFVFSDLVIC